MGLLIYADGFYKWNSISTTQERWTGKFWTDGKPIHFKQYDFSYLNLPGGDFSVKNAFANSDDVETITDNITFGASPDYINATGTVTWRANSSYVQVQTAAPYTTGIQRCILWYTKSTDTAGTIPPFSN